MTNRSPGPWNHLQRHRSKPVKTSFGPKLYDLHVHSVASDGLCTLDVLAKSAAHLGLTGLAITDHDVIPSANELKEVGDAFGVELLAGAEISTVCDGRGFHLLAYGFDPTNAGLNELCEQIQQQRRQRFLTFVKLLDQRDVTLPVEALLDGPNPRALGRRHLARALIEGRYAGTARSAVQRYLTPFDAQVPKVWVPMADAVKKIHEAGGVAVLAHPPTGLTESQWKILADQNLDGVEGKFGKAPNRHRRLLADLAQRFNWFLTAGSDYHGDGGVDQLGRHTCNRLPWVQTIVQENISKR